MSPRKSAEEVLQELKELRPEINKAVKTRSQLFKKQNKLYLEAYRAGASIRQIAAAVGLSKQYEAVRQAIRKMEAEAKAKEE